MAARKKVARKKAATKSAMPTAGSKRMKYIKAMSTRQGQLAKSITNSYSKAIRLINKEVAAGKRTMDRLLKQQKQAAKKLKRLTVRYRKKAVPVTKREIAKLNKELHNMAVWLRKSKLADAASSAELAALKMAARSNAALIKMMERTQKKLELQLAKPKTSSRTRKTKAKAEA
ncbi:MAG: hypothetical protein V3S73_03810 [Gammaproteobacteria bacterium]|nr:hypothetical protein [Gammaproteobacteria bacterium]